MSKYTLALGSLVFFQSLSAFGALGDVTDRPVAGTFRWRGTGTGTAILERVAPAPDVEIELKYKPGHTTPPISEFRRLFPVAKWLKENPDEKLLVEGYSNFPLKEDAATAVALHRVENLRKALVSLGAKPEQIDVLGYGKNAKQGDKVVLTR